MIGTLLRIAWSSFKRDRASLFLTFALPIIFFSIFSWIFGSMSGGGGGSDLTSLEILVLDLDQSAVSAKLIQKLAEQEALELTDALEQWEKEGSAATGDSEREGPPDREAAFRQVEGA